jgi:hypothetical protein
LAKKLKAGFVESSAKDNTNVGMSYISLLTPPSQITLTSRQSIQRPMLRDAEPMESTSREEEDWLVLRMGQLGPTRPSSPIANFITFFAPLTTHPRPTYMPLTSIIILPDHSSHSFDIRFSLFNSHSFKQYHLMTPTRFRFRLRLMDTIFRLPYLYFTP